MLVEYHTTCQTAVQTETYEKIVFKFSQNSQPISFKTTFDCGVQTNLANRNNPQTDITGLDQIMIKKRQKRKQYKKRKKIQKKMMQKQNKEEFKQIIDLFYQNEAKFVDYSDRLEELVCSFNQSQFKKVFDSILRQRVIIQNQIWQHTQSILQQNPLQMQHDHPFYLQMVDEIFKYYRIIQRSSIQAQQVIYIYLSLNSKQSDQPITPQDLGRRTFKYLVETDQTLSKLIHMCDKKITFVRVNQRQKLQIMISKLKNFRQRCENNVFDEDQEHEPYSENQRYEVQSSQSEEERQFQDQKSTAVSETSEDLDESNKASPISKKKKKKDLPDFEEDQQRLYNYLENLIIDKQNRFECYVGQDFSHRILKNVKQMSKSFKKHTEFDILVKNLDSLQGVKQVSLEYKRLY